MSRLRISKLPMRRASIESYYCWRDEACTWPVGSHRRQEIPPMDCLSEDDNNIEISISGAAHERGIPNIGVEGYFSLLAFCNSEANTLRLCATGDWMVVHTPDC